MSTAHGVDLRTDRHLALGSLPASGVEPGSGTRRGDEGQDPSLKAFVGDGDLCVCVPDHRQQSGM